MAKKPTTIFGVLGGAAKAFAKGKPQPPVHTLIDVVKAAKASADKRKLADARAKPRPKVEVTPKPSKRESVIKPAIAKGVEKASVAPTFSLGNFTTTSLAPHVTLGPAPVAVPAVTASPEPTPQSTGKHPHYEEAVQFLKTLGMKDKEARGNLDKIQGLVTPQHPVNELVRLALKHSKT